MARDRDGDDALGGPFRHLRGRSSDELAVLLDDLAARHPEVAARLGRHALRDDPQALATHLRQSLVAWKRFRGFRTRGQAAAFGRELLAWLDDVERDLLPNDPGGAHALADAFITSDARWFDQADDSDAAIGDAVREGCRLWLSSAKASNQRSPSAWIDRIYTLHAADQYGAREALLRHADLLFAGPELRALALRFEGDLERALAGRRPGDELDHAVFKAAAAVGLVAEALCDPDLAVRATLRYRPEPNVLQREQFVVRYLRCERAVDALPWLRGDWGGMEDKRLRLLAQVHAALGDAEPLRAVRRTLFDRSGAVADFEAWRASLPPADHPAADDVARARAAVIDDRITGAELLLAIGDAQAAETLLVEHHASVRGEEYYRLLPLVRTMQGKARLLGAVVCYRALLSAILARANARAYGHAAEYLATLRKLDLAIASYEQLLAHHAFEASLRARHPRKIAFWRQVDQRVL